MTYLRIGVLQEGNMAPNLFIIVLGYAMKEALLDQNLSLKIASQVGPNSRPKCPAK
jgi:hypothetical protein